jgi:predicted dehydrogenase
MGRNHARVYSELENAELVAVADVNPEQADKVGAHFNVPGYSDYEQMLQREQPDLVSVVVPTREHLKVARAAIKRGIHVLVEKPIASSVPEAWEMIRLAEERDVTLTVGHIERYNPAIIELKSRLDAGQLGRIFEIHARRLGPFPPRIRDVGVVVDLATHDLDIMNYIVNAPVERLHAETERRIHTAYEDLLLGTLKFSDGTLGILDINWLTPTKIRELIVTGERGMFVANYLTQELIFYRNKVTESGWNPLDALCGVEEGDMIKFHINRREPLREELSAFVAAVTHGYEPLVTGYDGLRALELAQLVIESSRSCQTVWLTEGEQVYEGVRFGIRQSRVAAGSTVRQ